MGFYQNSHLWRNVENDSFLSPGNSSRDVSRLTVPLGIFYFSSPKGSKGLYAQNRFVRNVDANNTAIAFGI